MDRLHRIGRRASPIAGESTGLVTQKLYADGRGPCYTYTDDGKLATRTWARGVTTSYNYDAWGILTSTTYSDGTPSVTFAYDALGRRTSVTDAKGTTAFTYDAFGDESQEAVTGLYAKTLVRHRDAYGRDLGHTMDGTRKNVIEVHGDSPRLGSLFNPTDRPLTRTIKLPLHYTGLTERALIAMDGEATREVELDAQDCAKINVSIPAEGYIHVFVMVHGAR